MTYAAVFAVAEQVGVRIFESSGSGGAPETVGYLGLKPTSSGNLTIAQCYLTMCM